MEKNYRILVADDNKYVREAVKKALGQDYSLAIVSNPEEAINYNENFDLFLTDFYFGKGKKNGLDIIKNWKEKRKDLSAILMSSELKDWMIDECKTLNAGTFNKYEDGHTPVDKKKLMRLINSFLTGY